MQDPKLVNKFRELREVKPNKDWVVFTKREILGEEQSRKVKFPSIPVFNLFPHFLLKWQPIAATLILIFVVGAAFGFSGSAAPGDLLYSVKKVAEGAKVIMASEEEKPAVYMELASRRLEELSQIAKVDQGNKLTSAIKEFEQAVAKVNESTLGPVSRAETIELVAKDLKVLKEGVNEVSAIYGVIIETDGVIEGVEKSLVGKNLEMQIETWEKLPLGEEAVEAVAKAKESYEVGDYETASQILYELWFIAQESYK